MIPGAACLVGFLAGCSDVSASPVDAGCSTNTLGDTDGGEDDDAGGEGDARQVSACAPADSDGVNGGCYAFTLTVDDTGFSPIILKTQNLAHASVSLKNAGTKPHDFTIGCISTAGRNGCPPETCFPAAASIRPVPPGGVATTSFVVPNPEGIYVFRSDVPFDSQVGADGGASGLWGQFVVQ
jgi:hypothetical protein